MAQIKSSIPDFAKKHIEKNMRKECAFCKQEKPFRIFWDIGPADCFYICKDCESILQGLFIDVVFETAEQKGKTVDTVIDDFRTKVHKVIEQRQKHSN